MALQPFAVEMGVALEDGTTVAHVLPTNGPPGGTAATDNAPVGSIALDVTTGDVYSKRTAGAGAAAWGALGSGALDTISWREPARVWDTAAYADITAAATAAAGGLIDGVSLVAGDRVLITGLTTGNANIYIWDGTAYTEDSNAATAGDHTYVTEGTYAGRLVVYSGSAWSDVHQGTDGELSNIRAFIGKAAAGAENPSYTGLNFITATDPLDTAIDKLDVQLAATDALLSRARKETTAANVSGNGAMVAVDSESMGTARLVQWKLYVVEPATGKVNTFEVDAATNGSIVDYTVYAKLAVGGRISGIAVDVFANGGNMELRVASGINVVNTKTAREVILA